MRSLIIAMVMVFSFIASEAYAGCNRVVRVQEIRTVAPVEHISVAPHTVQNVQKIKRVSVQNVQKIKSQRQFVDVGCGNIVSVQVPNRVVVQERVILQNNHGRQQRVVVKVQQQRRRGLLQRIFGR